MSLPADGASVIRPGEKRLAAVFMAGMLVHLPGYGLVPISIFLALFFAYPLLSTASRALKRLAVWTAIAVGTGLFSLWVSVFMGLSVPTLEVAGSVTLWLLAIPLLPALACWSLKRIRPRTGILLMLAGGIVSTALLQGLGWKGTLGIFITGFVLILLAGRPVLSFIALGLVVTTSVTNDARSMAVAAGAALFVQAILSARGSPRRAVGRSLLLAGAFVAVAWLVPPVLASGIAGAEVRARTLDQLSRGNVIFGVRAEWAITISFMQERPFGYGIGIQPNGAEASTGIAAVQAAGGDWTSNYFSQVVLGERVDLHSTTANLWYHFGIGGLAVALLLGLILMRGVRDSGAVARTLGMGGVFLMLMGMWDLLFSPMADVDRLVAGIVIALVAVAPRAADAGARFATEQGSIRAPS